MKSKHRLRLSAHPWPIFGRGYSIDALHLQSRYRVNPLQHTCIPNTSCGPIFGLRLPSSTFLIRTTSTLWFLIPFFISVFIVLNTFDDFLIPAASGTIVSISTFSISFATNSTLGVSIKSVFISSFDSTFFASFVFCTVLLRQILPVKPQVFPPGYPVFESEFLVQV